MIKRHLIFSCWCILVLVSFGIGSISAINSNPIKVFEQTVVSDDQPPIITIVNPTEGYFHFSGIKLFPTVLNLVDDTMGFGGFRVRPVQVMVTDDFDAPENILVYMYVYEDEQGTMKWNSGNELYERKWIGPDLGVFTMNISAQDTSGNTAYKEMSLWYFCFIPE